MAKYQLSLGGSVAVTTIVLDFDCVDDRAAIRKSATTMKHYHPVYYRGFLFKQNAEGVFHHSIADFRTKVEVVIDVNPDKPVEVLNTDIDMSGF